MKSFYIILVFCFMASLSVSQNGNRIEISGQIIANNSNLEAITVYNLISKIGTTTDKEGKFIIDVYENDILQISALQFQEVKITINQDVIKSKALTMVLVKKINQLSEVLIFSNDLSGVLSGDIEKTTILRPNYDALYFGIENKEKFQFAEDFTTKIENKAEYSTTFNNGANIAGLVNLIANSIFKPKKRKQITKRQVIYRRISDAYSSEYLADNLNLNINEVTPFVTFVEEQEFDINLLKKENKIQFLDFMVKQKKAYLEAKND